MLRVSLILPGLVTAILILGGTAPGRSDDPFIDQVVSLTFGSPVDPNTGFLNPLLVLGPPKGVADGRSGSLDVLNLGRGGEIVVRFFDPVIYDGTGADFTVFENPFFINVSGYPPGSTYLETGTVAVSSDGKFFLEFPTDYIVQSPPLTMDASPEHYIGFAGLRPVFSHPSNGISPTDPAVSGGDPFDLAELRGLPGSNHIDFDNIRFIRIRDTGDDPVDSEGDSLPEPPSGGIDQGFDLDAIAVVNGKPDRGSRTGLRKDEWVDYR
jgi:hypothetical protein